jgi:hypothetical protein
LYIASNSFGGYDNDYRVIVQRTTDTIVDARMDYDYDEMIDSLQPGNYNLSVYSEFEGQHREFTRDFVLQADSITKLNISFYDDETVISVHDDLYSCEHVDFVASLGYFNNKWLEDKPAVTSCISAGFSGGHWWAFSPHAGFVLGGGLGFTHGSIAKDTTFADLPGWNKRYEYYNYLDAHLDVKFRFSAGNQQLNEFNPAKWMIDLGASYYFPIAFKHITRFTGNQKLTGSFIHQYTDCRLFVNFGYAPALFFVEYRLFDFILGNYPELPTWNFGFRLNVQN